MTWYQIGKYGIRAFRLFLWQCIQQGKPLIVDRIIYSRSTILYGRLPAAIILKIFGFYYADPEELKIDLQHIHFSYQHLALVPTQ